jgi:putative FmdB family regulatory protein
LPIYEYRCEACGHTFEVFQKFSDAPVEVCERCGATVSRVFHPVAIHFKGSGFYTTDYGKPGAQKRPSKDGEGAAAERPAETGAAAAKTGDAKASTGAGSTAAPKDESGKKD